MTSMNAIPLTRSMICADCDAIFNMPERGGPCPSCASMAMHPLDRWLAERGTYKALRFNEELVRSVLGVSL